MNNDIIFGIHEFLVNYFKDDDDPVSPPGIRSQALFESACARPFLTAGGSDVYPDEFSKAAALFHGIISNHCFYNGNKRTALLSTLYFLSEYNYWVENCDDEEMYEFTRQIAAHEICDRRSNKVDVIKEWLIRNSRKVMKGERRLSFNDLRYVLSKFGYELIEEGTMASIHFNGQLVERILKKGKQGFEEYDQVYLSTLRKRLNLTVDYGIDSARFYGQKGICDELNVFMNMRGEVFRKLAKI
jgi:death-on-curing protein